MSPHYLALFASYAAVIGAWWIASSASRRLGVPPTRGGSAADFVLPHPWREVGIALLGALGVVAIGQLWTHRWLIPGRGSAAPIVESIDQILIFLPILAVPFVRRQCARTMLLPKDRVGARLVRGLALAALALTVYAAARPGCAHSAVLLARIVRFENLGIAVQVMCEDLAIGVLLYRVAAAVGRRAAAVGVAALFALAHLPALISSGAGAGSIATLGLDFTLVLMTVGTVLRSGDVLWFWPVHFAVDMTQFGRVTGL